MADGNDSVESELERLGLADELQAVRAADEPLVDSIYRVLRDAICTGRLDSGSRLAQIPLAEQFGVSRTPVRDALQRLASEELVRAVSWRGFMVSEFSARDVLEIYDVRLILEPLAASEAVGLHSQVELAELDDNCDRAASTPPDQVQGLYELNRQFHAGIVRPCPNRLLVRMLDQLWQLPAALRLFHMQSTRDVMDGARNDEEHRGIVAAIRDKDPDLVVQRVRAHISAARKETLVALNAAVPEPPV